MIIQPDSETLAGAYPVRINPYEMPFRHVELWLLMNIGPGNTGAVDLMEEGDRWNLGTGLGGHLTVFFVNKSDHDRFLLSWPGFSRAAETRH